MKLSNYCDNCVDDFMNRIYVNHVDGVVFVRTFLNNFEVWDIPTTKAYIEWLSKNEKKVLEV